ncbi:MAG: hypothetical protein ACYTHJ_03345 [Planctomycetota bacterium]|jgi:hypothetical protein
MSYSRVRACNKGLLHVVTVMVMALVPTSVEGEEPAVTCGTCHPDAALEHSQSAHARFDCQDCHGGSATFSLTPAEAARLMPDDGGAAKNFDHGDAFRGKPARIDVPELCGTCHTDVRRMNPFGLRTDQLARYWTSGHGVALREKKDERVAVCIDCHGNHGIRSGRDPSSLTHPTNIPETCATCHSDSALMAEYDLPVEVVDEYRQSVHGMMLAEGDTGAPTCATCHGNHSATPPGANSVGEVCGQCHQHAAREFETSVHATLEDFGGCIRCHGGGEGRHDHLVERITSPTGVLINRFEDLLKSEPDPSPQQVAEAIHPNPRVIIERTLESCTDCHDDIEDDESLPKLFDLLDRIEKAERKFVTVGRRIDEVGRGVLLVNNQRFRFEDAKTALLELAPIQHSLDVSKVDERVATVSEICMEIDGELDNLERGLQFRHLALIPIWIFALGFATLWYIKYRQLRAAYVKP